MPRIVLATCMTWPGLYPADQPYADALARRGVAVSDAPWNGPFGPFHGADLVVLRSNWDYHHDQQGFLDWLAALEAAGIAVLNPPALVRWNLDKHYLLELTEHGVPTPRTFFVPARDDAIRDAFQQFGGVAVIKPAVGASGFHVYKATAAGLDTVIAAVLAGVPERTLMVQEFLPEIAGGERSLVFFDGDFSHALCRQPDTARSLDYATGEPEFRANSAHGVTTTRVDVPPPIIAQARAVLDRLPVLPLYARVDGVIRDGRLILTELEVNEPSLRLDLDPAAGDRFAEATLRRLTATPAP